MQQQWCNNAGDPMAGTPLIFLNIWAAFSISFMGHPMV
jgi:hypothetical protein